MATYIGTCLCGDVAYEIDGPLQHASHCHCSYCRKFHGTPYATYAMAPFAGRRWLRGEDRITRYESSPGFRRWFCSRCGSPLPGDPSDEWTFVPLGNLDGDPGVRPAFHIFAASKAPWWEIRDALPEFPTFPPGIDAPVAPDRPLRDAPGTPRGSCLCGAVAFRLAGEPLRFVSCHCGRCRKAHGAAHGTNLVMPIDGVRFTRGEDELDSYKLPEARFFKKTFCRHCGAKMPRVDPDRAFTIVPTGALDDDPGYRPQGHIFVGSMAPWDAIHDELPRHDGPLPT